MVDIGHCDLEGIGDLLSRGASRFPDMVATDAHGIRPGHHLCGVFDGITNETNGWPHGKDPVSPANHLLQDVILRGSAHSVQREPIRLRCSLVHGEDDAGNGVNGQTGADPVKGDLGKGYLEIPQGIHGHANPPHLSLGERIIGIQAQLGGEVEGNV